MLVCGERSTLGDRSWAEKINTHCLRSRWEYSWTSPRDWSQLLIPAQSEWKTVPDSSVLLWKVPASYNAAERAEITRKVTEIISPKAHIYLNLVAFTAQQFPPSTLRQVCWPGSSCNCERFVGKCHCYAPPWCTSSYRWATMLYGSAQAPGCEWAGAFAGPHWHRNSILSMSLHASSQGTTSHCAHALQVKNEGWWPYTFKKGWKWL